MPVVRTFFTGGHFAVSVFFIISGYVLSAKPLSLIHSGEIVKLGDSLASSLSRRWLRLYIPVFVTTLLYFTSWHMFGIWTVSPNHEANFRDELWKFYVEFKNYSFAFRTGGEDWLSYNFPTWSIPVEFRGSLIIYTSLLAFSRCTRNMRLFGMVGLIFYFMYIVDGWFGSLFMAGTSYSAVSLVCQPPFFIICPKKSTHPSFLAGSLLCDLDLLARNDDLPLIFKKLERYKKPIFYTFFVTSMFLSGVPSHSRTYPSPSFSCSRLPVMATLPAYIPQNCFQNPANTISNTLQ
jgi:Acyltransferase family